MMSCVHIYLCMQNVTPFWFQSHDPMINCLNQVSLFFGGGGGGGGGGASWCRHMQNVDPVGLVAAGASPSQGHQSRHPSLGLWTREVYMDKKGRYPRLVSCKGQGRATVNMINRHKLELTQKQCWGTSAEGFPVSIHIMPSGTRLN